MQSNCLGATETDHRTQAWRGMWSNHLWCHLNIFLVKKIDIFLHGSHFRVILFYLQIKNLVVPSRRANFAPATDHLLQLGFNLVFTLRGLDMQVFMHCLETK